MSSQWSRVEQIQIITTLQSFAFQVWNMRDDIMHRAERDMEFACISIDGTLKPAP